MSTLLATDKVRTDARALEVQLDDDSLIVTLADGRILSVPLEWFPRLRDANASQRANWRMIGPGIGIHWEDIDEDISIRSLLAIEA